MPIIGRVGTTAENRSSPSYGLAFVVAAIVGGIEIKAFIVENLPLDTLFEWPKLPLGRIALTTLFVTLILWLLKTLIRLFLTHQHLATDAAERVTMIETYLALRQEGKVEDKDRELMIRPIFRRGLAGMQRDGDSPPTIVNEFIAKGKE